jgi:type IV pilus biogenesis protein CpaD/CtpE
VKTLGRIAAAAACLALPGGCAGGGPMEDAAATTRPPCEEPGTRWQVGCATAQNFAALAEDPVDLRRARQEGPRDAVRRDAVLNDYAQSRSASAAPAPTPITPSTGIGSGS